MRGEPISFVRAARLALFGVILTFAACTPASDGENSGPESSTTSTEAVAGVTLSGRIFALAGEQSLAYDLYELKSAPLQLKRLSDVGRVSALGGCSTMLVVAAAQAEVGWSDTIQVFRGGRFGPVEGLGTPKGFAPVLNRQDCRVAYTAVDRNTPELVNRLHVWDPKAGVDTIVHEGDYLSGVDWGPDGRLAVVHNQGGDPGEKVVSTSMVLISPDGSKKTMPAPETDLGGLAWAPSASMAFVRVDTKATLFFDPDTGARTELAGWWPVAWSPDGRQLLVSDAENHTELGVVNTSDLSAVERVGTAPVGVYGGVWLPAGATPEVGPAP